jgi:hypothetical protein
VASRKPLGCVLRLKLTFLKFYIIGLIAYIPQYVLSIIDNVFEVTEGALYTHEIINLPQTLIFHSHSSHWDSVR